MNNVIISGDREVTITEQASAPVLDRAARQWASRPADERFETLDGLRAALDARRSVSSSWTVSTDKISIEAEGEDIVINGAIVPAKPTHWSFGQLATTVKAPARYIRTLPANLAVDCLRYSLGQAPRESYQLMTVERGDELDLMAMTSPAYGRIWDADIVECVGRVVEKDPRWHNPLDHTGKKAGLYASKQDVFVFMIDGGSIVEVGPRAKLNRGFMVWNSEVGARTFGLSTFWFNYVCGNHYVWDAKDILTVEMRHTKFAPERFAEKILPALESHVAEGVTGIAAKVERAMDKLLPLKDEDLAKMCASHGFSGIETKMARQFALNEEGKLTTLWDLAQGFTAYARTKPHADSRVELEQKVGKMLDAELRG